jgi:hypothetical protein
MGWGPGTGTGGVTLGANTVYYAYLTCTNSSIDHSSGANACLTQPLYPDSRVTIGGALSSTEIAAWTSNSEPPRRTSYNGAGE